MGRFNAMTTITALTAIFTLAIWVPIDTRAGAIIFAVLYGFTSGSYVALIPACVAQLSPAGELGIRLGTNSMAVAVAVLFSNPIGGALLNSENGTFLGLQIYAGMVQLVGASLFGLARFAQESALLGRA